MARGHIDEKFLDENGRLLPELNKFNWGACLLSWIWGIGNNTYIALIALALNFIPPLKIVGFAFCKWLGVTGNEWALKNKEWDSVEHFNRIQKRWATWGVIITFVIIVPLTAVLTIPSVTLKANETEQRMDYKKAESVLNQAISLQYAINDGKIDMSSGHAIAQDLSDDFNTLDVQGNKLTTTDNMTWVFECSNNTSCIVTVDTNGEKGPNQITKDIEHLKDQAEFKIVKGQNGMFEIIKPKWLDEMYKY